MATEQKQKLEIFLEADLPQVEAFGAGRRADSARVTLRENGQIAFNSFVAGKVAGIKNVIVAKLGNNLVLVPESNPETIEKHTKKGSAILELKTPSSEKGQTYCAGSRILRKMGYDYKVAGNQTFDATFDDKGYLHIPIPTETPARKPTVTRVRKPKNTAPANGTAPATTPATAPAPAPVATAPATDTTDDLI